ncbi:hypothetical protein LOAG_10951 [Loa loa]|uniref:Uncharacterized protein n=1 Tax=Loa loa TaxID=7209 RepID=A0A1S0TQE6_LOALO|nr:hypothetical protein LOAG_10951 [Loa loa]EFO17549.1 hypothetical protein LOAG_10951 [Loa loa]
MISISFTHDSSAPDISFMHDGFAPDISFMHDNSAPEGIKIVNISSAADVRYFFNVPYGVGKAAIDKLSADIVEGSEGL